MTTPVQRHLSCSPVSYDEHERPPTRTPELKGVFTLRCIHTRSLVESLLEGPDLLLHSLLVVTTAGLRVCGLVRQGDADVAIPSRLLDEGLGTARGEGLFLRFGVTAVGSWSSSARIQCTVSVLGLSRNKGKQHTCPWCFLDFFDVGQGWTEDIV